MPCPTPLARSLVHHGLQLSVLARYGVLFEVQDGALVLQPAVLQLLEAAACADDVARRRFAARHAASDAAAKDVMSAPLDTKGKPDLPATELKQCKAALMEDPAFE